MDGPGGRTEERVDPKALGKPLAFVPRQEVASAPEGAVVREGRFDGAKVWDISVPVRLQGTDRVLGAAHMGLAEAGIAEAMQSSL
jgi:hypothetical protein